MGYWCRSVVYPLALSGLLSAFGCGGGEHGRYVAGDAQPRPDVIKLPDAAKVPDAGEVDAGPPDAEPGAPDAVPPDASWGPTAEVISPDKDGVIVNEPLTKLGCRAVPNSITGKPVTKVEFQINEVEVKGHAVSESSTDWGLVTSVDEFPNGEFNVTCIAGALDGLATTSEVRKAFLDLGPLITILSPANKSSFHGNIRVDFVVTPSPIMQGDTLAGLATEGVHAYISAQEIPVNDNGNGSYSALIRADDEQLFGSPLNGEVRFTVTAQNKRGNIAMKATSFNVDNDGPVITILKPGVGDLVGGTFLVEATIADATSAVDERSAVAAMRYGPTELAAAEMVVTDGKYRAFFYSSELRRKAEERLPGVQLVFPTITVRARDVPGNESVVGRQVALDYTPPVASLDTGHVREAIDNLATKQTLCSWLFDPLGDDALNDRQLAYQVSAVRARVEDRGNIGAITTSHNQIPRAFVKMSGVQLFVLDHTDEGSGTVGDALVVDTDGDGRCDEINPMVSPTTFPRKDTDAVVIDLGGINTNGRSYYQLEPQPAPGKVPYDYDIYPAYVDCQGSIDSSIPFRLTPSSGLQRTLQMVDGGELHKTDPAIFSIPPMNTTYPLGWSFDSVANGIEDGWACLAVRAEDNLGNVGVSAPIRVCFDHDGPANGSPPGCPQGNLWYPPLNPDVTDDKEDVPVIPRTAPAGMTFDCVGSYYRKVGPQPERTEAKETCTADSFPQAGELIRIF
ncbi:MAG: hypothetical protein HY698_07205 [Deltaproteobacteria bacterium]|nr:hypothetical protein [Deltaproteobacteria bacterium]